jgi:HAD superfamily hydrolase (TIGR01549 family)
MLKAVIFDMDGTMVDTEEMWLYINREVAGRYNVVFDESLRIKMMGRIASESLTIFRDYYNLKVNVSELVQVRKQILLNSVQEIHVNPGLVELLELLKSLSIRKAIAISSFKEFTDKVLMQFDLKKYFDVIVTSEDIINGKPNPEIFLLTAKKLETLPIVRFSLFHLLPCDKFRFQY